MTREGLPIAAYLAMLVALALGAAFVAVFAIVIWLPPRPPDVMRADIVADQFEAGYTHARETGEVLRGDGMAWRLQREPPRSGHAPHMHATHMHLARQLALAPEQVRVDASRVARSDVLVFRVREMRSHMPGHQAEVIIDRRRRAPEAGEETPGEETRSQFEIRIPEPPPRVEATPPVPPAPPIPPTGPPMFAPAPPGVVLVAGFEIAAQLPDGRWLVMRQGRNWDELGWIASAATIIGAALAVLSVLALLFARRLTRPIRNFSDAVQAVGVDPQSEPVREEGPSELRGAARAVNTMQARLRALIADRTKTLAAVAHDMRTPLMRLRLAAENAPAEQRERMAKEIGEVEALVASFIAFARDDPAEEARVRLDLSALLQSIADDHTAGGRNVSFAETERTVVTGQSLGLRRLFANLVDNALKYGATARIALQRSDGVVLVDVEDDGPGIPAEERESVFEPFVRLNHGASGAGLGLAAARAIARAHGGDIVIIETPRGAKFRVTLPE